MQKRQWKLIIKISLLTVLLPLLPFLPGPGFLSVPTNFIFSLLQFASIYGLLLIPIGLIWHLRQVLKARKDKGYKSKAKPVLLWLVPAILILSNVLLVKPVRDFSRNFAMHNADVLIKAIESYENDNGHYPSILTELSPKYLDSVPSPRIMGISKYNYSKREDSFDLTFSQNMILGFNSEVVVYNPIGNHEAEGELTTLYETGKDKWKYYIYD